MLFAVIHISFLYRYPHLDCLSNIAIVQNLRFDQFLIIHKVALLKLKGIFKGLLLKANHWWSSNMMIVWTLGTDWLTWVHVSSCLLVSVCLMLPGMFRSSVGLLWLMSRLHSAPPPVPARLVALPCAGLVPGHLRMCVTMGFNFDI